MFLSVAILKALLPFKRSFMFQPVNIKFTWPMFGYSGAAEGGGGGGGGGVVMPFSCLGSEL